MSSVLATGPLPTLSYDERDRRWGLAQELLAARDLDALLVYGDKGDGTGQPFIGPDAWFTNDRPGSVVIVPRGGAPYMLAALHIAAGAHMDAVRQGDPVWIPADHVFVGGTTITAGGGRSSAAIAEVLHALGLASARLGVIGLDPFGPMAPQGLIPYGTFEGLRTACPGLRLEPTGGDWLAMALPKSAEELALLEVSCRAGELMCAAMLEAIRPGVPENEVYAAAMEACFAAGATTHWMILVRAPGGQSVGWGPPPWTFRAQAPRRIESGDVVLAELFPSYGLIDAQQELSVAVGKTDSRYDRAAGVARDAYEAGLSAMRPGRRFGDIVDRMQAVVDAAGGWQLTPPVHTLNPNVAVGGCGLSPALEELGRYGNPGGLSTHGADLVLRPGMMLAMQANCSFGRYRANIGGTVTITEDGARDHNELPSNPRRVGWP